MPNVTGPWYATCSYPEEANLIHPESKALESRQQFHLIAAEDALLHPFRQAWHQSRERENAPSLYKATDSGRYYRPEPYNDPFKSSYPYANRHPIMRKPSLLAFLIFLCLIGCAQNEPRIGITSITPSENTGQDYSNWLNDDLSALVPNCWTPANFKYIDVTLGLSAKSSISRLSLYDLEGIFADNPATLYALNGNQKTLLGTFTGDQYKVFVDIRLNTPVEADALVIHKYCNNIPQKIQLFGSPSTGVTPPVQPPSLPRAVITFSDIAPKKVGDAPFMLIAASSNPDVPLLFNSSNPAVISVEYVSSTNSIMATVRSAGTASITVSQAGNSKFAPPSDATQTITVSPSGTVTIANGKIPIDSRRWFQLTNAANGLQGLFDGNTSTDVHTGWGKILDNYDSYYPVLNGEQIDLSGIRLYDGAGNNASQPVTISVITRDGQRIAVGKFTGSQFNTWVGPDPGNPVQFNLSTTFSDIRYIVLNSWNEFPTEIEFYGNYTPGKTVSPFVKKPAPLRQMFGVNGFEWNFELPNSPGQVDKPSLAAARNFTGFRHYMDWSRLELTQGSYSFNPTTSGSWNYDALYDSCKAAGIEVLACLKTLPSWMLDTYPADQRDAENVPVRFGKDFADPNSYIEQAKLAFQYAARYGSNKNVDRSLLSVNTTPRWGGDVVNTVKAGLDLVRYFECENERDKWWRGRKAYQTAYEYAANLSAFYDGNKNTMGPGVGVKNADPNMKVVMAGTALATTDYLKGMVDWCRQHRGYKADGSVNLCWDVINYHLYSNDSKTSQNGNATRGAAPEISGAAEVAAEFLETAHLYANDLPVWVTELGYDINQNSPFRAIPVGSKPALQTQADWTLRSSLLYARAGVERIFFYEMYDDNLNNPLQFSSSGLLNADKSRKPAADYINQVSKKFGDYVYKETISTDPLVDRYELNGQSMYAIMVPDEKGRTAICRLNTGNARSVRVFTPRTGAETMDSIGFETPWGQYSLYATETPVFVVPLGGTPATTLNGARVAGEQIDLLGPVDVQALSNTIQVFPNPASDVLKLTLSNLSHEEVSVRIIQAGSGKVFKNIRYSKPFGFQYQSIDIHTLPTGYYYVEILQGPNRITKTILKYNQPQ